MRAISIYNVIKTVIREKEWYRAYLEVDTYGEDVLTFTEFSNIMLFNEVTTYDRKINELYKIPITTKLARKTNKSAIIVSLDEVHKILVKYNKITPEFSSAYPEVAFAVTCGNDSMIVSYDKADGTLTDGSTERPAFNGSGEPEGMTIRILAEGNNAEEQDLTPILVQYGDLQSAISVMQTKANTSAMAVWGIYNASVLTNDETESGREGVYILP